MKKQIFYMIILLCPLLSICAPKNTLCTIVVPPVVVVDPTPSCAFLKTQTTLTPTQLNLNFLASAAYFGVLAYAYVTATGPVTILGSVASNPTPTVTYTPVVEIWGGITHTVANPTTNQARTDLLAGYSALQSIPTTVTPAYVELGGLTLLPGTYSFTASVTIAAGSILTLDGNNVTDARWIFKIGGSLVLGASTSVQTINGGLSSNVYWVLGGFCTLGASSVMIGNIVATSYIVFGNLSSLAGRALSTTGYVTLTVSKVYAIPCKLP